MHVTLHSIMPKEKSEQDVNKANIKKRKRQQIWNQKGLGCLLKSCQRQKSIIMTDQPEFLYRFLFHRRKRGNIQSQFLWHIFD